MTKRSPLLHTKWNNKAKLATVPSKYEKKEQKKNAWTRTTVQPSNEQGKIKCHTIYCMYEFTFIQLCWQQFDVPNNWFFPFIYGVRVLPPPLLNISHIHAYEMSNFLLNIFFESWCAGPAALSKVRMYVI